MEWSAIQVSDVIVAEPPLQYTKARGAPIIRSKCAPAVSSSNAQPQRFSAQSQRSPGAEYSTDVPIMINKKAVAANEELVVFRRPKRKEEKQPAPVKVAKLMEGAK